MICDSLLGTLASLRSFEKKLFVPENFLTAAFAFLLKIDKPFLKTYLKHLGYRCSALPDVQTQKTYGIANENIPDMVISDRHTYIVQENKIDAAIGKNNQLVRYARQVKESKKRIKGLVYVRRRHRPHPPIPKSIEGIRIQLLTWDKVAYLIKRSPVDMYGKSTWLREEFYRFLEDRKMTFPAALNISRLKAAWKHFEPQNETLKRIIEESRDAIQRILGNSVYQVRIPHSSEEYPGIYIYYTKGRRLKKAMRNQDLWVWCGVYLWEDEIYADVEIGWGQKYEQKVKATFRNRLEKKGFEYYAEPNHSSYPYEAYGIEKPLSRIIGSSNSFEKQSNCAALWFAKQAKVIAHMLGSLERLM